MLPRWVQSILESLVRDGGARSAFVLDRHGTVAAFFGTPPSTDIIWLPPEERLARGPVSTTSASGERLAFAALDAEHVLAAVFSDAVPAVDAERLVLAATVRH